MSLPALATHVKQGESKEVAISISRGTDFDEDVTISFESLPKGVTAEPASPMIKHGETEVKATLTAEADAALGNFTVNVTGHPTKGADAKGTIKLTVDEK